VRLLVFPFALAVGFLIGCGDSSESAPSSKPLTGTIEKKTFTAKSAFALTGMDPSSKFVVIRNKSASCSDLSGATSSDLLVTVELPWKAGVTESLDKADVTVTLEDLPDRIIALTGEVDVVHAPEGIGSKGAIRLLADAGDGNSKVDGEVDVLVCE
jgi:hypothetical protein